MQPYYDANLAESEPVKPDINQLITNAWQEGLPQALSHNCPTVVTPLGVLRCHLLLQMANCPYALQQWGKLSALPISYANGFCVRLLSNKKHSAVNHRPEVSSC